MQGKNYAQDTSPSNFIANTATKVGGSDNLNLMALLYAPTNGAKGNWVGGKKPDWSKVANTAKDIATAIQISASAFNYLSVPYIRSAWWETSNSIELVCDAFDNNFWGSAYAAAPGTPFSGPAQPAGVTSWGLRTAWCLWIDNHLAKIEANIGPWLTTGKSKLQQFTTGSSQLASLFISTYMSANGLASTRWMHFPQAANFGTTPLPGTAGSAITTTSRYGMWGNNYLGALGV